MEEYILEYNGQFKIENGSGIYSITNILNNNKYIGSTSNFRKRYRQHLYDLNNNIHHNKHLQNVYNKYGSKIFKFVILERCENIKDTLIYLEQKYLNEFGYYNIAKEVLFPSKSYYTGHPISNEHKDIIRKSNKNRIWNKETLIKKSEFMKNSEYNKKQKKEVLQYSLDGVFIKIFDSINDAAKSTGHLNHRVSIKRCCQNKNKTAYNYKWKFNNDNKIFIFQDNNC